MQSDTPPDRPERDEPGLERPLPFSARSGCLLSILLGAAILCLGLAFFQVAFRGGLSLRTGSLRETRLWLVQNEGAQGLGFSRMQRVSGSEQSGEVCLRTRVGFWLWSGSSGGLNTSYCDCYEKSGSSWIPVGTCSE
jgi:hypothetical protein